MLLNVMWSYGRMTQVEAQASDTWLLVRTRIETSLHRFVFVLNGQLLEDNTTVGASGLQALDVVFGMYTDAVTLLVHVANFRTITMVVSKDATVEWVTGRAMDLSGRDLQHVPDYKFGLNLAPAQRLDPWKTIAEYQIGSGSRLVLFEHEGDTDMDGPSGDSSSSPRDDDDDDGTQPQDPLEQGSSKRAKMGAGSSSGGPRDL